MWGNFKKKQDGFSDIRKVPFEASEVVFPFPSAFAQINNSDNSVAFNSNGLEFCYESNNSFTFTHVLSKTSNNTAAIIIPHLEVRNVPSCKDLSCTSRETEIGNPAKMVAIEIAEIIHFDTTGAGYVLKNRQVTYNRTFGILYASAKELPTGNTCPVCDGHVLTNTYTNNVRSLFVESIHINRVNDHSRVPIEVTKSDRLTAYHDFVPNSDIENDVFLIEFMEQYPNNQLQLFNQWGVTVFDKHGNRNFSSVKAPYRNTITKNQLLPSDTFFYLFQPRDNNLKKCG